MRSVIGGAAGKPASRGMCAVAWVFAREFLLEYYLTGGEEEKFLFDTEIGCV